MRGSWHRLIRPLDEFGEVVHEIEKEAPAKKLRS